MEIAESLELAEADDAGGLLVLVDRIVLDEDERTTETIKGF